MDQGLRPERAAGVWAAAGEKGVRVGSAVGLGGLESSGPGGRRRTSCMGKRTSGVGVSSHPGVNVWSGRGTGLVGGPVRRLPGPQISHGFGA